MCEAVIAGFKACFESDTTVASFDVGQIGAEQSQELNTIMQSVAEKKQQSEQASQEVENADSLEAKAEAEKKLAEADSELAAGAKEAAGLINALSTQQTQA